VEPGSLGVGPRWSSARSSKADAARRWQGKLPEHYAGESWRVRSLLTGVPQGSALRRRPAGAGSAAPHHVAVGERSATSTLVRLERSAALPAKSSECCAGSPSRTTNAGRAAAPAELRAQAALVIQIEAGSGRFVTEYVVSVVFTV